MFAIPPAPIHFREIFKTKVWGARRLETLLGKSLPPGEPVGESWEISDHPHGLSRVDAGVLAGMSLHDLVPPMRDEIALVGRPGALELGNRFPLLFKFIDTADFLSVQVHPADDYARKNEQGDPGKIEATPSPARGSPSVSSPGPPAESFPAPSKPATSSSISASSP